MTWTIENMLASNAHALRFAPFEGPDDHEREALLISDLHWDNPKCNRDLLKTDLEEAKRRGAPVLIAGDLFCAMQGKYDPRGTLSGARPEHQVDNYLDALVETAAEWFEPYAECLAMISPGNHCTNILRRHHCDLTQRLVHELRRVGSPVQIGGYQGFVRAKFSRSTWSTSRDIYYHHGHGGGAPVTKGAIQYNRLAEQVDADVYWMGHIHRLGVTPTVRLGCNEKGAIVKRDVEYVRTSTYKDEGGEPHGWAVEKGHGVRPLGGYWLHFKHRAKNTKLPERILIRSVRTDG